MSEWQPIETAPKGGGAEMVTDPEWVEPPHILLCFADEPEPVESSRVVIAYWDWYYAPGGDGYRGDGSAWVIAFEGETTDRHFGNEPTHWMPLPAPPTA